MLSSNLLVPRYVLCCGAGSAKGWHTGRGVRILCGTSLTSSWVATTPDYAVAPSLSLTQCRDDVG